MKDGGNSVETNKNNLQSTCVKFSETANTQYNSPIYRISEVYVDEVNSAAKFFQI